MFKFDPNSIELLILAGGKGTRLSSVVNDRPKPMALIDNKPFLDYLVRYYTQFGFSNYCFLTGFKSDTIRDYYAKFNCRISDETIPLGTGGAIKQAIANSKFDHFLVVNGDSFFKYDPKSFILQSQGDLSIALRRIFEGLERFGTVDLGADGFIESFNEKSKSSSPSGLINAGCYSFSRDILNYIPSEKCSMETDVFPVLAQKGNLRGVEFEGDFIDIGIPEEYHAAQEYLPNWLDDSTFIQT